MTQQAWDRRKVFHKNIVSEKHEAEKEKSEHDKIDKKINDNLKKIQQTKKEITNIESKFGSTSAEYTSFIAINNPKIATLQAEIATLEADRRVKKLAEDKHKKDKEALQAQRNSQENVDGVPNYIGMKTGNDTKSNPWLDKPIDWMHKSIRGIRENVSRKTQKTVAAVAAGLVILGMSIDKGKLDSHTKDNNDDTKNKTEKPVDDRKDNQEDIAPYEQDTIAIPQQEKIIEDQKSSNKNTVEYTGPSDYTGPEIDNYEYYDAEESYRVHTAELTKAYENYQKGTKYFKYHEVKDSFSGIQSSFWRERNLELGRDANDTRIPLKPGEHIEKLKTDNLVVSDFSVKDDIKFSRLIIVKKGTEVVVDASGRVVATAGCINPWRVNKSVCPPGMAPGDSY